MQVQYQPETGLRIRDRRVAAGLSQQILATQAGIAVRTLSRIEQGDDLRLGTLALLAHALDCTLAELVAG